LQKRRRKDVRMNTEVRTIDEGKAKRGRRKRLRAENRDRGAG
jgi:hypothetical protein